MSRFNIVLITVDSLRPDFIGCYNENAKRDSLTPNTDKWAQDAFIFKNAISQGPRTDTSFPAIMSGLYSNAFNDMYNLSEKRVLISELLKQNGYTTYAINSNPYLSRASGYNRGFDFYKDFLHLWNKKGISKKILFYFIKLRSFLKEPYEPAQKLNWKVFSWLKNKREPFFFWIHYMDVHGPYYSKKGWKLKNRIVANVLWRKVTKYPENLSPVAIESQYKEITEKERAILIRNYKEEIRSFDCYVSELLERIDDGKTLIIILSDHGDMFGEHGCFGHPFKLYEELLKVPLIMKIPGKKNTKRIDTNVRSIDMVPTICDLLSLKVNHQFDGESLLPLIEGNDTEYSGRYIISEIARKLLAVRVSHWKLILNNIDVKKELFNLKNDPGETNNLVDQNPAKLLELENVLNNHIASIGSCRKGNGEPELNINEEIKLKLKSLGYM